MQHTLKRQISLSGTGLHSGAVVSMTLRPAPASSGIVFIRTDVTDRDNVIPALWDRVVDTRLCTVIANAAGASVGTIEHLMAALRGCAVDNLFVELNGPEVPVMDGSAEPFVTLIDEAGLQPQDHPRRAIRVLKDVMVEEGGKSARLTPGEGSVFSGHIDFTHPSIGVQTREIRLLNGNFRHDIASSRTFGFLHEVETLRKHGLALGGSLENAIVLDDVSILNPDGLRHQDEFIRHKLLDAVGDIYLAGAPLLGAYDGHKAGHALNNALLRKLFATDGAWESVTVSSLKADTV
jgi:UDP-3-O-[3-hydroxymyristoyl] N-acetylglucosamine deacetylase